MASDTDDKFAEVREPKFVGPGELTDLALLPGRFDAFANKVESSFEMLANRILPALDGLKESVAELRSSVRDAFRRVESIEARADAAERRADDQSKRLAILEANSRPKRRTPRK